MALAAFCCDWRTLDFRRHFLLGHPLLCIRPASSELLKTCHAVHPRQYFLQAYQEDHRDRDALSLLHEEYVWLDTGYLLAPCHEYGCCDRANGISHFPHLIKI